MISKIVEFSNLFIEIIIGVIVYFAIVLVFKIEEALYAKKIIVNKLKLMIFRR